MLGLEERRALFIVLKQAEVELSAGLSEWLKEHSDGQIRFTAKEMRKAIASVKKAMVSIEALRPATEAALLSAKKKASLLAINHIEKQFSSFSFVFDEEVKLPDLQVASLLEKGDKLLLKKYPKSAKKYAVDVERHIRRQLALGVLKKESLDALAGRLTRLTPARMLEDKLPPPRAMAKGLMQMPRSNAFRLVRTEALNAYNAVSLESIQSLAEDDDAIRKRWDSSLDRRGCLVCRDLDEEVQPVSEPFSTGVMHAPQHPNCRCTVVPWAEHWKHDSMKSTGTEGIDAPDQKPLIMLSDERAPAR